MRGRLAVAVVVAVGVAAWWLAPHASSPPPVREALAAYRSALAPSGGAMTEEEARSAIARRKADEAALSAQIAAGGSDAVAEVREAWAGASSRERLLFVQGLRDSDAADAVDALAALYAEADLFRVREEILRALGEHPGAGAHPLLLSEAAGAEDERLAQIAAAALYGEADALAQLTALIRSPEAPMNARLEAVQSVGGIDTAEADEHLRAIAADAEVDARVRVFAEKEAVRER